MDNRRKKITIISLIILIIFLLGVSIYIGVRLQNDQAPPDSSANVWCTGEDQCPVGQPVNFGGDRCFVWAWESNYSGCGGLGRCFEINNCASPDPVCNATFPGGVTGAIVINNCGDQQFEMEVFWRDAPRGSTDGSCVGTVSNRSVRDVGNGNYNPRNDQIGCGKCVQYDIESPNRGGVAQYTGDCPQITCYECTASTEDGNLCESFVVEGNSCPAGSTTNSACETAVGGACPVSEIEEPITCYRCTTSLEDGNTCEPFTTSGPSCPAGSSSTEDGCAAALAAGICPVEEEPPVSFPEPEVPPQLPETAIFSDSIDRLLLGFLMILLGVLVYRFDLISKLNTYLYVAKNLDISEEVKVQEHLQKVKKLKKSRKSFENRVDKSFNHKSSK